MTDWYFFTFKRAALLGCFAMLPWLAVASDDKLAAMPATQLQSQMDQLQQKSQPFALNIYFDNDSSVVKPQYKSMLNDLIKTMTSVQSYSLELTLVGHTDSKASNDYNLALGQRRAKAVSEILSPELQRNFVITSLMSQGEENPLNSNSSALEKALNRRVTIEVTLPIGLALAQDKVALSGQGGSFMANDGDRLVLWNTLAQCPQNIFPLDNEKVYVLLVMDTSRNLEDILFQRLIKNDNKTE